MIRLLRQANNRQDELSMYPRYHTTAVTMWFIIPRLVLIWPPAILPKTLYRLHRGYVPIQLDTMELIVPGGALFRQLHGPVSVGRVLPEHWHGFVPEADIL